MHRALIDLGLTISILLGGAAVVAQPVSGGDPRDLDFARRGFVATRRDPLIRDVQGRTVWDLSAFDFLAAPRPDTANASLWAHARLMALHGLFRVTDRIWQVRGFDLANITFVRGDRGWIVIDTLGSTETARAARELVDAQLGAWPISAVVYTHPHADHFGGAAGLISAEDATSGRVPVIAPKGFLEAAVGENVIAGPAMQRRAGYQFGTALPRGATGQLNAGIGPGIALGTGSLIPPTREVERTGETIVVDGVSMRFQLTPHTEAPAEMNVDFPDWDVVDMAENANATQHNILTPRGAQIRDAKQWADALTESIRLFGGRQVLITSHGWPRFGRAEIVDYLSKHRDAYAYLHDQTVRWMNKGLTGDEIAARIALPEALAREPYNSPYYGSLSFNARAVYQFYMGWYDADPAHLVPAPPAETGRRYVEAMGGAARVLALARQSADAGDLGWAARLLDHVVMADAGNAEAREALARCYEQLAWTSENALWRNMYLVGANELRRGPPAPAAGTAASRAAAIAELPTPALFDLLAVRLDPDRVAGVHLRLAFVFPDRGERVDVAVENGVLIHQPASTPPTPVDATVTIARTDFVRLITGAVEARQQAVVEGDASVFGRWLGAFDAPAAAFPIVTR